MAHQVYFVTALSKPSAVAERLPEVIPDEGMIYKLANDKWFVVYDGISRELAEKLGMRGDPFISSGLVLPVSSYSGRAPTDLWEWLRLRME
ncbi:hypothetical protein [Achromobacter pulmonis]|uniref:hypothetical protein n=1 Tax=Achromobacter pulmonis TaxID=1389932 RepID=UPI0011B1ECBA|nr:hypothetical protein [Achromobacter pulmonis]